MLIISNLKYKNQCAIFNTIISWCFVVITIK